MYETGNTNTMYSKASDGSSNSGDTYSFEYYLQHQSVRRWAAFFNLVPTIDCYHQATTPANADFFQITYTGERWRLGATGRSDKLDFNIV